MAIRAVVFDIGGVLEITPELGVAEKWEQRLHLKGGELNERMGSLWDDGGVGKCTLEDVVGGLRERLGMDQGQIDEFFDDLWTEYLGQPNTELIDYCRGLRPRYQTAMLSNSFVGAREKEEDRYQFEELVDEIIYSHEVGMAKPDRRIFELSCGRLGVQPAEMIFLDDNEIHFVAARELGIHAILFQNTAQAIADIEAVIRDRSN